MLGKSLILAVKKLSRKEMTRLRDFAASPYHNKNKEVAALAEYLSAVYPDFSEKRCDKHLLWEKITTRQDYDEAHLKVVFSYTLRLFEEFMTAEKLATEAETARFLCMENLRDKQLFNHYEKVRRNTDKNLRKKVFKDADYYLTRFKFAEESDQKYLKVTQQREDDGLQQKQDALDLWFMAMKLRDACEMKMRTRLYGQEYEAGLLTEVLEKIKRQPAAFQRVPAVFVYYLAFEMLRNNQPADYFLLKERIEAQSAFFRQAEQQNIYNYLQNFCIRQINQGATDFHKELFEIYRSQLEKRLIFDKNGKLLEWHYKNIVTVGLRSQNYTWVRRFLDKYKNYLLPEVVENAYSFNLANYYFAVKNYPEVLPLLIQVEYSDMRYKLDVRALLLRTYFHLRETEPFYALCDAFNQLLLRSKKLTDFQRDGYRNMIRLTRRIFVWRESEKFVTRQDFAAERKKIKEEAARISPIFNESWLRGEMNE